MEFCRQFLEDIVVLRIRVTALHFMRVTFQVKQVPFVREREVDQLVLLGSHAKVLGDVVFAAFVVGVVQRFPPLIIVPFE